MALYLLSNIRAQYPEAKLGIMVASRGGMLRDLLAAYPWIEVVEANRRNPASLLRLWREWRGSDLVVTQYGGKHGGSFSLPSKLVARILAKRGGLVGFTDTAARLNARVYDHLLPVRPDKAVAEHEREALRAAGLSVPLPYPEFAPVRKNGVPEHYGIRAPYAILHVFAGNRGRSLSPARSRELLTELRKAAPDVSYVVSAGPADGEDARKIADGLGTVVQAPLQDIANLIAESRFVVSVDTGVAHISAQMGKPLIVLATCLGPNWWFPEQYGPRSAKAFVNNPKACESGHIYVDYPPCINDFNARAVAQAATSITVARTS